MSDLAKLAGPLEQLFAQMKAAQGVAAPSTAAYLETLAEQIRQRHAEFASEHARVSAELDQQVKKNQQDIEQAKQKIAQAKQEIKKAQEAAAKKPAPPPLPAPPPPIDPALGRKLRAELLERFGGQAPALAKPDWELWNQLGSGNK